MSTPAIPEDVVSELVALQQESPLLMFLFDANDQLRYANAAFRKSFSLADNERPTWSELMTKCRAEGVGALIATTNFPDWLASARSRRGKLPYRAFESDLCDGRWMWITETMSANGWMMCVGIDITDLRANAREVRQSRDLALRAAQTDVLTGISNRAHIMQQLEQRLDQVRKRDQDCGIALIDLDKFKFINDSFGHSVGDYVLMDFTRIVLKALRHEDGFGRIGGEEFMLIFPRVDAPTLEHIISRILQLVRDSRALSDTPDFIYTCSAGLGVLRADDTVNNVYRRVDEAMYAAKAAGRDCFRWAT